MSPSQREYTLAQRNVACGTAPHNYCDELLPAFGHYLHLWKNGWVHFAYFLAYIFLKRVEIVPVLHPPIVEHSNENDSRIAYGKRIRETDRCFETVSIIAGDLALHCTVLGVTEARANLSIAKFYRRPSPDIGLRVLKKSNPRRQARQSTVRLITAIIG